MTRYELHTGQEQNSEYGTYETYGVTALRSGKIICIVEDISLDKEKVEGLIKRFNEEKLSPAHLYEAIENFLYDFEVFG